MESFDSTTLSLQQPIILDSLPLKLTLYEVSNADENFPKDEYGIYTITFGQKLYKFQPNILRYCELFKNQLSLSKPMLDLKLKWSQNEIAFDIIMKLLYGFKDVIITETEQLDVLIMLNELNINNKNDFRNQAEESIISRIQLNRVIIAFKTNILYLNNTRLMNHIATLLKLNNFKILLEELDFIKNTLDEECFIKLLDLHHTSKDNGNNQGLLYNELLYVINQYYYYHSECNPNIVNAKNQIIQNKINKLKEKYLNIYSSNNHNIQGNHSNHCNYGSMDSYDGLTNYGNPDSYRNHNNPCGHWSHGNLSDYGNCNNHGNHNEKDYNDKRNDIDKMHTFINNFLSMKEDIYENILYIRKQNELLYLENQKLHDEINMLKSGQINMENRLTNHINVLKDIILKHLYDIQINTQFKNDQIDVLTNKVQVLSKKAPCNTTKNNNPIGNRDRSKKHIPRRNQALLNLSVTPTKYHSPTSKQLEKSTQDYMSNNIMQDKQVHYLSTNSTLGTENKTELTLTPETVKRNFENIDDNNKGYNTMAITNKLINEKSKRGLNPPVISNLQKMTILLKKDDNVKSYKNFENAYEKLTLKFKEISKKFPYVNVKDCGHAEITLAFSIVENLDQENTYKMMIQDSKKLKHVLELKHDPSIESTPLSTIQKIEKFFSAFLAGLNIK